jgi:hypothetical protein
MNTSLLKERVVPHSAKLFAERLNHCLDETDAPSQVRERAVILSKMIDIPKQQAWALLEGQQLPDQALLQQIANEFEVEPDWLIGNK